MTDHVSSQPAPSADAAAPRPSALPQAPGKLDTFTLRRLELDFQVDRRSILKEHGTPGSVRGMAGHRARAALQSVGLGVAQ